LIALLLRAPAGLAEAVWLIVYLTLSEPKNRRTKNHVASFGSVVLWFFGS
jgi:hypothetical protein